MQLLLRIFISICGLVLFSVHVPAAFAQCGDIYVEGQFGPFDYADPKNAEALRNVNGHHFNRDVETLKKGLSSFLGDDLDYTLRAFPNHYRALLSLIRYKEKNPNSDRIDNATYSIPCYFERAVEFVPQDATVRVLYGKFLTNRGKHKAALEQLQEADKLSPNDANIKYNLGLALFEMKEYDEAAIQAKRAQQLGFPYAGLQKKLESVGRWPPKDTN